MEQRRLRLGDILDDYCPRERRVTNHAVVAMIEEDVKQTRCTTCDAEHAYKGGKGPRRRKKDATTVLYEEVLAGMPEAPEPRVPEAPAPIPEDQPKVETLADDESVEPVAEPEPPPAPAEEAAPEPEIEEGPFHRRLIRATLPRPEGQKETRQLPDFTIRSSGGNGHNPYRGDRSRPQGQGGSGSGGGSANRGGGGRRFAGGGSPGMPGARGGRGPGRPGFGGGSQHRQGGPSTGSGRGPTTGSGRGPSTGSGHGRKRSR